MKVSLTPELEAMIQAKIATGMYNNPSEVIREALRLLAHHDQLKELKRPNLQQALSIGLDSLNQGEFSLLSLADIRTNVLGVENEE